MPRSTSKTPLPSSPEPGGSTPEEVERSNRQPGPVGHPAQKGAAPVPAPEKKTKEAADREGVLRRR